MILLTVVVVNVIVGVGMYFSVWTVLKKEYSQIVIGQKIVTAQRIKAYEDVRSGDATINSQDIDKEADLLSDHLLKQLKDSFMRTQVKIIPVIILLLIIIFLEGVFLSNRIAGPIYHVNKSLKEIKKGDLRTRTYFRKHDEFKDLYQDLNYVIGDFEESITKMKEVIASLESGGINLKARVIQVSDTKAKEITPLCDDLIAKAQEASVFLAKYKVKAETPEGAESQNS